MADPGLSTPVQPVRGDGTGRALAAGVVIVLLVGLLAWHPWVGPTAIRDAGTTHGRVPASGSTPAGASALPPGVGGTTGDASRLAVPTTGPWSGRVAAEWSVVAFLRADPVSRDPLDLDQQPVAPFAAPAAPVAAPDAVCDAGGAVPAAADLPTREVRYLGIAYPAATDVTVERVVRDDAPVDVLPIALGRISGPPAIPAATAATAATAPPDGTADSNPPPAPDPVRIFALPGGGPWPDGIYRFDVAAGGNPPLELFACIRA